MTQIGYYTLQEELGAGGMGTVYRGTDTRTHTAVAIKALKSELNQPVIIERFVREGEALRDLNHPNIVKLLDTIEENGQHYLVMEYVSGGDLTALLRQGQIPLKYLLRLSIDLADALTRAHKLDIVHRDLKPGNVLIGEDGTLRLTDFGVAQIGNKDRVTQTGLLVGTVDYMPPESFSDDLFDVRGDIWAFGVMLFEMLAGERPFKGDSIVQSIYAITNDPIPDLEAIRPDVPTALVDLVYRMLEKDPNARIPSVRIVGAELEAILLGNTVETDRITPQITYQPGRFETTDTPETYPNNLPSELTPFVGREAELAELTKLVNDSDLRLITVIAPGGMGKTRLAIKAAESQLGNFADGVYFVDLAPLTEPSQIATAIADHIDFNFAEGPLSPPAQLIAYLKDRQQLLILDNFEHVVEGAGIVSELLKVAPQVQIIATSRIKLNLSGETLIHLGGMDFPGWETPEDALQYSAVKLFMQSAKRVQPGFELKADDLTYIARICRLVQGLPLGILLSAAWIDSLTPHEIAIEIAQSADVLETELRDVPERQRSIRAVFEYSLRLLPDHLQKSLYKLSVFSGGFTREAAVKVADANIRTLTALANHSLIQRDAMTGRYSIHELVRQYAKEALRDGGEYDATRDAHAAYFCGFFFAPEQNFSTIDILSFNKNVDTDWDNIASAWKWLVDQSNFDLLQNMIWSLHGYSMMTTRYHRRDELIHYAYERVHVPIEDASHRFLQYLHILELSTRLSDVENVYREIIKSIPYLEASGETEAAMWARVLIAAFDALIFRNFDRAIDYMLQVVDYADMHPNRSVMIPPYGDLMRWIMIYCASNGEFDKALRYGQRALDLDEKANIYHVIDILTYQSALHIAQGYITGDFSAAIEDHKTAFEYTEKFNDHPRRTLLEATLALIEFETGKIDDARRRLRENSELCRTIKFEPGLRRNLIVEGYMALFEGDIETAQRKLNDIHQIIVSIQMAENAESNYLECIVRLIEGNYEEALQAYTQVIYGENNPPVFLIPCINSPLLFADKFGEDAYFARAGLHIFAAIQAGLGHHTLATELLGKLSTRRDDAPRHWLENLPVIVGLADKLASELDNEVYAVAFERGKTLNLDSVIDALYPKAGDKNA